MIRILLAGGGTLGSVSPLLAVKETLPDADYLFVGTKDGPEAYFVRSQTIRYKHIAKSKFRRYFSILNFIDAFKFPYAFLQSFFIILGYKPHVILTSGGFVAVPIGIAARLLRIPVVMHQQDIEIGLANRILTILATRITTTFPQQAKSFPKNKVVVTGNPVRNFISARYPQKDMILILGGSLGARGMNESMNTIIPELTKSYEVIHVLGQNNYNQRLSIAHNYKAIKFLTDDFGKYTQEAKVIVTRAGMSTITELSSIPRALILVPMPNSHQEKNAHFLAQMDAALYCKQNESKLIYDSIIHIMTDDAYRSQLENSILRLFPSNAKDNYHKLVTSLLSRDNGSDVTAYFVGIGGIGISALAYLFKEKGFSIAGSDLSDNEVTRQLRSSGAIIRNVHSKKNVPDNTKILIYSSAVPENNEEILEARRRHIEVYSYNEYLGSISETTNTIAITGTHGKTTTTALTGYLLKDTTHDPMVIVGSLIPQFGFKNYYHGSSSTFVVEACEYRSHMLLLHPNIITITNIDKDHMDFYQSIDDIIQNFERFVALLPHDGTLIKNNDDPYLYNLNGPYTITFGLSDDADYFIRNKVIKDGVQSFDVYNHDTSLGTFQLHIPGEFNIMNALASIAIARLLNTPLEHIRRRIAEFKGSWRRFELVGTYHGSLVYSDYAHHPTAIRKTLEACKEFYPDKKIILVYQPHSFDRTYKLRDEFIDAFARADTLIITNIYDVAGRDISRQIDSQKFFDSLKSNNKFYEPSFDGVYSHLSKIASPDSVVLIMGAGTVDDVARSLISKP